MFFLSRSSLFLMGYLPLLIIEINYKTKEVPKSEILRLFEDEHLFKYLRNMVLKFWPDYRPKYLYLVLMQVLFPPRQYNGTLFKKKSRGEEIWLQ